MLTFRFSRLPIYFILLAAALAAGLFATLSLSGAGVPGEEEEKAKSTEGRVDSAVVNAPAPAPVTVPVTTSGFAPQTRVGFTVGDQWEPALAADRFGHVYVLYPQYLGVPDCPDCPSPTMILQMSEDGGLTWGAPRIITRPGSGQWDPQIEVDPVDGKTAIDAQGATHAVWGEGFNYDSPGSIWYTRGQ